MRRWSTEEGRSELEKLLNLFTKNKRLEPGMGIAGDPVDLCGLSFPTVSKATELQLPTVTAKRVVDQQRIDDVLLKRVSLTGARLDFSVWNRCKFEEVTFDRASLRSIRFFGCAFQRCRFRSVDLRDSSFSIATDGSETEISSSSFDRADLRGASCHNPRIANSEFSRCKLDHFVFDGASLENVRFSGKYHELTFRALPGQADRNGAKIDLSDAEVCWVNADDGVDLSCARLPASGSMLLVIDRLHMVEKIRDSLGKASAVGKMIYKLFSDHSISPLSHEQTTIIITLGMIRDFDGSLSEVEGRQVLEEIRRIVSKRSS